MSTDTNAALAEPAIKDQLAETGYEAGGSTPEDLGRLLKSEIAKWGTLMQLGRHQTRLIISAEGLY